MSALGASSAGAPAVSTAGAAATSTGSGAVSGSASVSPSGSDSGSESDSDSGLGDVPHEADRRLGDHLERRLFMGMRGRLSVEVRSLVGRLFITAILRERFTGQHQQIFGAFSYRFAGLDRFGNFGGGCGVARLGFSFALRRIVELRFGQSAPAIGTTATPARPAAATAVPVPIPVARANDESSTSTRASLSGSRADDWPDSRSTVTKAAGERALGGGTSL